MAPVEEPPPDPGPETASEPPIEGPQGLVAEALANTPTDDELSVRWIKQLGHFLDPTSVEYLHVPADASLEAMNEARTNFEWAKICFGVYQDANFPHGRSEGVLAVALAFDQALGQFEASLRRALSPLLQEIAQGLERLEEWIDAGREAEIDSARFDLLEAQIDDVEAVYPSQDSALLRARLSIVRPPPPPSPTGLIGSGWTLGDDDDDD